MTRTRAMLARRVVCVFIGLWFASPLLAQGTLSVQVGTPPSPPTPLVNHGDLWRYHKGTNAPQTGWQTISDASLNTTWASGNGGIGYADNANETSLCHTLLADMRNRYTTAFLPRAFPINSAVDP